MVASPPVPGGELGEGDRVRLYEDPRPAVLQLQHQAWGSGLRGLRYSGTQVSRYSGTQVPRYPGTQVPRYSSYLLLRYSPFSAPHSMKNPPFFPWNQDI